MTQKLLHVAKAMMSRCSDEILRQNCSSKPKSTIQPHSAAVDWNKLRIVSSPMRPQKRNSSLQDVIGRRRQRHSEWSTMRKCCCLSKFCYFSVSVSFPPFCFWSAVRFLMHRTRTGSSSIIIIIKEFEVSRLSPNKRKTKCEMKEMLQWWKAKGNWTGFVSFQFLFVFFLPRLCRNGEECCWYSWSTSTTIWMEFFA